MGRFRATLRAARSVVVHAVVLPIVLLSLAWVPPALATDWTFDWATLGWSPNGRFSMPRLYTNVAGSGIDVRIGVTWNNTTWLNGTPLLDTGPGQGPELTLQVDFGNISNNPKVNVLYEFFATGTTTPVPVAIKGIAIRDIDRAFYRDVLTVTGVDAGGATVDPDFISQFVATPNWSPGPGGGTCTGCTIANTVNATGAGVATTDPAGWAAFNFASTKVRSMTIVYSAGDGNGNSNPQQQFVWLSDFIFSDTVVTTQAVIASFGLRDDGTVEWETASEVRTAGFNLLRFDEASDRFVKVNGRLLPALVGSPQGGVYRYPDPDVVPGNAYTYAIEEIEATGSIRRYGPFRVVAGASHPTSVAKRAPPRAVAAEATARQTDGYARQARAATGRVSAADTVRSAPTKTKAAAAGKSGKSNTSVRVLIEHDGLYSLTADEIAVALGVNAQQVRNWIGKNQMRLQQRGQPVAWMAGPGNERMYFYGQAIDGSDRVHTRYNVYWLDKAEGLAMKVVDGKAPAPVATVQSFASRVHAEEKSLAANFLAADPDADFWYWNYVLADDPDAGVRNFPLLAPGAIRTGTATLRAYLQGATDLAPGNDHRAQVSVNGAVVGNAAWDGIAPRLFTATFDAGLLAADGNNTVTVAGTLDPGVGYSVFWVQGFDLEYARAYEAAGDRLRFAGAGNRVVTVGGFSAADIAVVDISDPRRPQWVAGATVTPAGTGHAVSFAPARPKADYFAALVKAPVALEGTTPPILKSKVDAAGYLVLTPGSLRTGADALAAYRGASVVELQDIYDAFNYGIANPGAIREFLAFAHDNWKAKPRHVALIGKGTIDPKDYLGFGTNLFPVLMSPTPHGLFASDNRYADIHGSGVPAFAIGRVPALTSDDVIRYVAKVTDYERNRGPADQALIVSDVRDAGGDFAANGRAVAQALAARGFETAAVDLADVPVDGARAAIIDTLNSPRGVGLLNFIGHGGVNVLANAAVFGNDDVGLLNNGDRLPVFLAFTCAAGDGSFPGFDSLAETLLWRVGGGAVATIAPTGLSDNGQAHTLNLSLIDALAGPRASATLGEANATALADLARKGAERYMLDRYSVIGDPALRVQP